MFGCVNHLSMAAQVDSGRISEKGNEPPRQHQHEVFSASKARHLDSRLRWIMYRPDHLAGRYIQPGNRVLDFGCGPGFFTGEFARRVGDNGSVIAVDLQEEMLTILREKLEPEGLMTRIRTHQCGSDTLALLPDYAGTLDVAFAIFVVHEVPDPRKLLGEIWALLVPGGRFFYAEPPFIVSGREFRDTLALATKTGFRVVEQRFFFLNRAALLQKGSS
jgi:ubiquinone/menaquinone biosynthesis C-methylase UbiE